ncbi:hypothetical protein AKJ16_DCAP07423 [Drosera capensis]
MGEEEVEANTMRHPLYRAHHQHHSSSVQQQILVLISPKVLHCSPVMRG